jgi:hypothetical protein
MGTLLDLASLVTIPSGYKVGTVYSVVPTDGAGDLTFTRSNDTATRVGPNGLIEKVRTNLALYSEEFDNAAFAKYSGTISTNTSETTDPLGGNAADIFVSANATASSGIEQNIAALYTSGTEVTVSIFAKYKNTPFIQILAPSFVSTNFVNFNIQTGEVAGGTYTFTPTITSVGNGWFRCSFTFVSNFTGTTAISPIFLIDSASSVRGSAFTGDGVKAAYIFGAQAEVGVLTDYIATTTAAVSVGPVANLPRLDYLNSTCPNLLLEPQRTNLVTNSENTSGYSTFGSTFTQNTATSPQGYVNADTMAGNGGSVQIYGSTSITFPSAGLVTVSVFAKANNASVISILMDGFTGASPLEGIFDLANGTTASSGASMQNYGNGWYRCIFTTTVDAGDLSGAFAFNIRPSVATLFWPTAGDANGKSVFVWGFQAEAGAYATSYIPTLGAASTRGVEVCKKDAINSLIGGTSGTVFFDIKTNPTLTSANYKQFCYYITSGGSQSYLYLDGSNRLTTSASWGNLNVSATPFVANTRYKVAFVFAPNDFALYVNGVSVATASSGTPNNNTDLQIGQFNGGEMCEFVFNQYTHFPTRLSNSEIAQLTTL